MDVGRGHQDAPLMGFDRGCISPSFVRADRDARFEFLDAYILFSERILRVISAGGQERGRRGVDGARDRPVGTRTASVGDESARVW